MLEGILFIYTFFISLFVIVGFGFGFLAFVGPFRGTKFVSFDARNVKIKEITLSCDYEIAFEKEELVVIRIPKCELQDLQYWLDVVDQLRYRGVYAIVVEEGVEFFKVKKC